MVKDKKFEDHSLEILVQRFLEKDKQESQPVKPVFDYAAKPPKVDEPNSHITEYLYWAIGNHITCTINGFILTFGAIYVAIFNCLLALIKIFISVI